MLFFSRSPLAASPVFARIAMVMTNFRFLVVAAVLPAAASFALGGKIDGPGKPKAAADVESGAVCKRMTESTEESIARPFRAGR